MPPPSISDATLGSRFWINTDFSMAARPVAANNERTVDVATVNKHNSNIFTFVNAGGDSMAKNAIGKAELFAATHTLSIDDEVHEQIRADNNYNALIGDENTKNEILDAAVEAFRAKNEGVDEAAAREVCNTAFRKLLASQEFTDRAKVTAADLNRDNGGIKLDAEGIASLKNATAGLAHMIRNGQISEKAVIFLADGNFYDAANRTDMLRLAAESAKKVKSIFIGEERVEALVTNCLIYLRDNAHLSEDRADEVAQKINTLRQLQANVINARKAATACIKTNYLLTDPTGDQKKDSKFQKNQIDEIRNSLRAFRYDLDRHFNARMGTMEKFRRWADDKFSSTVENRMTEAQMQAIEDADTAFNTLLTEIREDMGIDTEIVENEPAGNYANATDKDLTNSSKVSFRASAKAATHLSHLTNDRIRYHYSGIEKRNEESAQAIRNALGDISKNTGSRTVTLRVSADFVAKLGIPGVTKASLNAGGAIDVQAEVSVSNKDGTVSVSYSVGLKGHAGVSVKVGVDPDDDKLTDGQRSGLGAKAGADANANVRRKTTKVYANLEEFIRDTSKYSPLVNPQISDMFLRYGGAAIRGIGRVFLAGATVLGLRISRSRMDQLDYSRELRNRNVFGPLAGVFAKKRNVEMIGERKGYAFGLGAKVSAEGGIYVTENGEASSNLSGSVAIGYDYTREFGVKNKSYASFATSFSNCSANYLTTRFDNEIAAQEGVLGIGNQWAENLSGVVNGAQIGNQPDNATAIKDAINSVSELLTALEDSAIGKTDDNTEFWDSFAAKARLLAVATALLSKRAEALNVAIEGAADAKAAAKAAVDYIIPRLANPVVKVPDKIYRSRFFDVFDLGNPPTSKHTAYFEFSMEVFKKVTDDLVKTGSGSLQDLVGDSNSTGTVKAGRELVGTVVEGVGTDFMDAARDVPPIPSKFQVRYTRTNFVGSKPDKRPWMVDPSHTLDIRINSGFTLGLIVNAIARSKTKKYSGLGDEEVAKVEVLDAFKTLMKDTAKSAAEAAAVDSIIPLMDLSLGELAKKYSCFDAILGGAHSFDEKMKADHDSTTEAMKTIRFNYSADGRLTGFALIDDTEYASTLKFDPVPMVEVSVSLESKTSVGVYSVLTTPNPNKLMSCASDYIAGGNISGFKGLLANNKIGVKRLVKAGRAVPGDVPGDKYWQKDCTSMKNLMADLAIKIGELKSKGGKAAQDAAKLHTAYKEIVPRMITQPDDITDEAAIALANDFFLLAANVYNLNAIS